MRPIASEHHRGGECVIEREEERERDGRTDRPDQEEVWSPACLFNETWLCKWLVYVVVCMGTLCGFVFLLFEDKMS